LVDYERASLTVRRDLVDAHSRAWRHIAEPGTWWTGAERVAIAAEARAARTCSLCVERKQLLAPTMANGAHGRASDLPEYVVDAVHRIATDAGRLASSDYRAYLDAGLSDGQYVEIIGVVVNVVCVDTVCSAVDNPQQPLPQPIAGEPTRHRPPAAVGGTAWVPMLPEGGRDPDSKSLYGRLLKTPHVARALSLVPDEVRGMIRLAAAQYIDPPKMMNLSRCRAINRPQIELVAARVSAINECFY